jgi:hypothetical protein
LVSTSKLEYECVEAEEEEDEGSQGLGGGVAAILLAGAVVHHHLPQSLMFYILDHYGPVFLKEDFRKIF